MSDDYGYLWVSESHFERRDDDHRLGLAEIEPYETGFRDLKRLFRAMSREYGRCTSKVYVDVKSSREPKPIGWVFEKREQYEESRPRYDDYGRRKPPQFFIREVWVTVHTAPDTVVRTSHVADLRELRAKAAKRTRAHAQEASHG